MFNFESKDKGRLKVFFNYGKVDVPANERDPKSKPHVRPVSTTCVIVEDKENPATIATGQCVCNNKDHFTYKKGRQLSLARALHEMGLPKEEREVVWNSMRKVK